MPSLSPLLSPAADQSLFCTLHGGATAGRRTGRAATTARPATRCGPSARRAPRPSGEGLHYIFFYHFVVFVVVYLFIPETRRPPYTRGSSLFTGTPHRPSHPTPHRNDPPRMHVFHIKPNTQPARGVQRLHAGARQAGALPGRGRGGRGAVAARHGGQADAARCKSVHAVLYLVR